MTIHSLPQTSITALTIGSSDKKSPRLLVEKASSSTTTATPKQNTDVTQLGSREDHRRADVYRENVVNNDAQGNQRRFALHLYQSLQMAGKREELNSLMGVDTYA